MGLLSSVESISKLVLSSVFHHKNVFKEGRASEEGNFQRQFTFQILPKWQQKVAQPNKHPIIRIDLFHPSLGCQNLGFSWLWSALYLILYIFYDGVWCLIRINSYINYFWLLIFPLISFSSILHINQCCSL